MTCTLHGPRFVPHPIQKSWVCQCCATALKMKSRRLRICVSCHYCWVCFVNIAKMYGNLFSGRLIYITTNYYDEITQPRASVA